MAPAADIHADRILILDFGAQYTQLIARRIRELGVYCEIHPWDLSEGEVRAFGARGVILSGGPQSVIESPAPVAPRSVFELGVPALGICYGMQTMAQQLGGEVISAAARAATPKSRSPPPAACSMAFATESTTGRRCSMCG
jgi:GMP synthase (glutamine-hydrolysing)